MSWTWSRRGSNPVASAGAIHALAEANFELKEARQLRQEAAEVGAMLKESHDRNHFGLGLERAIQGTQ